MGIDLVKPTAPFEQLDIIGDSVNINTKGKVLVLPSGNTEIFPSYNEYTLNSNRLTITESPFGGLKGSGSPDYAPGTLFCQTDGVYLTDVNGQNTTKTLTAGKQKELGTLTVDTVAHTITQEFCVVNNGDNNPTVIDNCDATTNWGFSSGTGTITVENGKIKVTGTTDATGLLRVRKNLLDLPIPTFIKFTINSSISATLRLYVYAGTGYKGWSHSRLSIAPDTDTTFVFPFANSPSGTTGTLPNEVYQTLNGNVNTIYIGIKGDANTSCTFYVDNVIADVVKSAYVELQIPNQLADTSAQLYTHNGTAYQLCRTDKLDSVWSNVSATPANCTFLDSTKLDDVYGSGLGRAVYPKGVLGDTKTGSNGTITYSTNNGTRNRIGFMVQLPPSDEGRTNFNKVRIKIVLYFTDDNKASNILPDISGNGNNGTMSCVGLTADNKGNAYGAMKFDGVRSYVNCGNHTSLNITGSFTIVGTVKLATLSSTQALFGKGRALTGGGSNGYFISFVTGENAINIDMYSNTTRCAIQANGVITDNNSHRVVISWDGTTNSNGIKIYVDGILKQQGTSTITDIYNTSFNFYIGASSHGSMYTNGSVNDVRMYTRTWTPEEVTADSNNQPVSSTGLVAHWQPKSVSHMGLTQFNFADSTNASYGLQNLTKPWIAVLDNPRTDILPDSTGNGNNGTMTNVSLATDSLGNPYGALSLNGVNSKINLGNPASLKSVFEGDVYSVAIWLKRPNIGTSGGYINENLFSKWSSAGGNAGWTIKYRWITAQAQISLIFYNGSTYDIDVQSTAFARDDNVHLVTLTRNNITGETKLYLDNSLKIGVTAGAGITYANNHSAYIGSLYGATDFFNGLIPKVQIFNKILSTSEISALTEGGQVSSGLVASYKPYQPSTDIDFYLFTDRPKNLEFKRDETGNIYELTLHPGNGQIYHGQITYPDLTLDSDSDLIPNCLNDSIEGSLAKFLKSYGMVI